MAENLKKIGIMGGTFDPVHIGHLILGEKAYEQLGLEKVLFMPSGNPPHKKERIGRATDGQRVEMVQKAITGNPHFALSLAEMHEEGYSYTYRTLERLKQEHPDEGYYFIIGADSLFTLDEWMEPGRICRACTIVVAVRNHVSLKSLNLEIKRMSAKYQGKFLRLDTQNIDISSAYIRELVSEGKSIRYYVPEPVREYIYRRQIYHA